MNQNLPCLRQCEKVMAYSCVEVWFEIGHEASERAKRTAEGFTHDWEVFVRGVDNADIHYFVEKVVFHLHETFSKPKRVVKEPPYSVKESGYAGFILPIEVYFKNKDEPKKVKYSYDLQLRYNGSPFTNVKKEKYTFANPSEDFRRKLIRGGGVGVLGSEAGGNSVSSEKTCAEEGTPSVQPTVKHSTPTLAGKPKLTSDPPKKAKIKEAKVEELKSSNSFADLFGTPIKTKVSPDPKKSSQSKVSPVSKNSKSVEKTEKLNSDKQHNASKPKHIPQKEIKKERDGSVREDKGERKDKNKDRDRMKEKSSNKHSTSPPKLSKEEIKKSSSGEHKERVEPKSSETKSEKKKDKRAKDERVKKEKHKDVEKVPSEKSEKSEKHAKESKEKEAKKSPKHSSKEVEKVRDKEKHVDAEKDKMRHKHKKKDKYKKVKEESKEREKSKKAEEKEVSTREHHVEKHKRSDSHSLSPSPPPSPILTRSPEKEPEMPAPVVKDKPSKNPLSALCEELEYHTSDSSSSHLSGDDDVIEPPKLKAKMFSSPREPLKPEPVKELPRVIKEPENFHVERVPTPEPIVEDVKPSKHKTSSHKEKGSSGGSASKSKSKDKSIKKKEKEVMDSSLVEVKDVERKKKKRNKRNREEEVTEELPAKKAKEEEIVEDPPKEKIEKVNDNSALKPPADNPSVAKSKFSKEYVSELLDLQKKIMTIKDDSELQRVVQVLAQSGKYEINNKSFDVDLCALDKSTVKKLQEFFTVS